MRIRTTVALVSALLAPELSSGQQAPRSFTEIRRIESNDSSAATTITRVGNIAVSPTGLVYVGQSQDGVVRVFDAAGKYVHSLGRRGQGPGEFATTVGEIGFAGDTTWVRDNTGRRINLFARDGRSIGSVNVPQLRNGRCSTVVAFLRNRNFVLNCGFLAAQGDSSLTIIADANGTERQVVSRVTNQVNVNLSFSAGGPNVTFLQPFAPLGDFAFAPNSSRAIIVAPAPFWNGRPGQVRITFVESVGGVRSLDLTYPAKPFNNSDADTLIANRSERMATVGASRGYQRSAIEKGLRDGLYRPTHFSEVADVRLGDDGSIWTSAPYDPNLWRVHNADGVLQFTVRIENGMRIVQVSSAGFWALRGDADGVPVIVQMRISGIGESGESGTVTSIP